MTQNGEQKGENYEPKKNRAKEEDARAQALRRNLRRRKDEATRIKDKATK